MSAPSNDFERCTWASWGWGFCVRGAHHPGRRHQVIDGNGDLVDVPGRTKPEHVDEGGDSIYHRALYGYGFITAGSRSYYYVTETQDSFPKWREWSSKTRR